MFLVQNNWDFGFNCSIFVSLNALSGNPNLKRGKPTPVIEVTFMLYQVKDI
jgi:hypothetical protein